MRLSEPRKTQLLTGILLVAVFAAGVVTGAGAVRIGHRPPMGPPGPLPLRELDLTADQERAAQQIMERYRPQLEAVVRESFPKVRALSDQMESEVRALLTPAQQQRLTELKARRPGQPPRPPPGMGPRADVPGPGPGHMAPDGPGHLMPEPLPFAPDPPRGPAPDGARGFAPQPASGEPPPSTSP